MNPRASLLALCLCLPAGLLAQPAAAVPETKPMLTAPVQIPPPACGQVLHNFPRTLTLKWAPVARADYYVVEVDCFGAHQAGHWDSEANLSFKAGLLATTLTYNGFPGDNKGRWRVQAVRRGTITAPLVEGPWSRWCDFAFETAPRPKPPRPPVPPTVRISRIECGDVTGNPMGVRIAISITSPGGVAQWHVWSTWGGSTHAEKTFTGALPTTLNEVVPLVHLAPDTVNRPHQWGLSVTVPGFEKPFLVYEFEPGPEKRCPGHYVPEPGKPPKK